MNQSHKAYSGTSHYAEQPPFGATGAINPQMSGSANVTQQHMVGGATYITEVPADLSVTRQQLLNQLDQQRPQTDESERGN
jgi:hypothetical protein